MKKIVVLSFLVALLAFSVPSFALNVNTLSSAMSQYASVSEWMNMIMHPGMPKPWTNPMLPVKMKQLSEAQDTIRQEVNSIEAAEDMKKARAVAETYKMCDGVYRDVGRQLEMMLDERAKFLQVHQ
jgi:hypothetical protein